MADGAGEGSRRRSRSRRSRSRRRSVRKRSRRGKEEDGVSSFFPQLEAVTKAVTRLITQGRKYDRRRRRRRGRGEYKECRDRRGGEG